MTSAVCLGVCPGGRERGHSAQTTSAETASVTPPSTHGEFIAATGRARPGTESSTVRTVLTVYGSGSSVGFASPFMTICA